MKRRSSALLAGLVAFAALYGHLIIAAANNTGLSAAGRLDSNQHSASAGSDCLITVDGDVSNDGAITSADIIVLCNFTFKGGAEPQPCLANGDVNCSGTVTSADMIMLIHVCFKGGAPPCDICSGSPLASTCDSGP